MKIRLANGLELQISWSHRYYTGAFIEKASVKGRTQCIIISNDGTEHSITFTGIAVCSKNDVYSKEIGRRLSLKKALANTGLHKGHRKDIWTAYFLSKPKYNINPQPEMNFHQLGNDDLYTAIGWPDVQEYMEKEWFESDAILDVDSKAGLGSSTYLIPIKYIKNLKQK